MPESRSRDPTAVNPNPHYLNRSSLCRDRDPEIPPPSIQIPMGRGGRGRRRAGEGARPSRAGDGGRRISGSGWQGRGSRGCRPGCGGRHGCGPAAADGMGAELLLRTHGCGAAAVDGMGAELLRRRGGHACGARRRSVCVRA